MYSTDQVVMHYKFGLVKVLGTEYNQEKMCDCVKVMAIKDSLIDYIDVNDKSHKLRELITKEELEKLVAKMNVISDRMIKNKKEREFKYNTQCLYGSTLDLIIIVKRYFYLFEMYHPSYMTQKEIEIFKLAKEKLFQETSYVMNIKYEEAEEYLFKKKTNLMI